MKNFQNKKICLLGLGAENHALLKFWQTTDYRLQTTEITICDSRNFAQLEIRLADLEMDFKLKLGKGYDKGLDKYDVILRSPGYPLFTEEIKKAKKKGVLITSAMQLFMEHSPTKNIIGVTGSKGKGTTSSLIYEILKKGLTPSNSPLKRGRKNQKGCRVFLGGNIGTAPFEFFHKLKKDDWVVLELSSFQMEDLQARFKIAVITNLFKEHLSPADPNNPNYHKSMKSYWQAKANIFRYQKKSDFLVVNKKLRSRVIPAKAGIQVSENIDSRLRGNDNIIFYTKSELPSKLTGEYNKENIQAAVEAAKILKIKKDVIAKAVAGFKGLPHRLEKVVTIKGVEYYDDSFATTPEASILALKSFAPPLAPPRQGGERNIILLAGGADKGADFSKFAREIKKRVKYLILFKGSGTDKLIKNSAFSIQHSAFKVVASMKEAMKIAKQKSEPGDMVLLSTACASFGVFKNYKERGNQFKEEVK